MSFFYLFNQFKLKRKLILSFEQKYLSVPCNSPQPQIILCELHLYHCEMLKSRESANRYGGLLRVNHFVIALTIFVLLLQDFPNYYICILFLFCFAGACRTISKVRSGQTKYFVCVSVKLLRLWPQSSAHKHFFNRRLLNILSCSLVNGF